MVLGPGWREAVASRRGCLSSGVYSNKKEVNSVQLAQLEFKSDSTYARRKADRWLPKGPPRFPLHPTAQSRGGQSAGTSGTVSQQVDPALWESGAISADLAGKELRLGAVVLVIDLVGKVAPVAARPDKSFNLQRGARLCNDLA